MAYQVNFRIIAMESDTLQNFSQVSISNKMKMKINMTRKTKFHKLTCRLETQHDMKLNNK